MTLGGYEGRCTDQGGGAGGEEDWGLGSVEKASDQGGGGGGLAGARVGSPLFGGVVGGEGGGGWPAGDSACSDGGAVVVVVGVGGEESGEGWTAVIGSESIGVV
jgi:hypothetical protein